MKYLLALPLLLCSCVTSGDIRRIEDALADETKTVEEVQATVAEVADRVDERTEGFIEGIGNAGGAGTAGLMSLLSAVGLNLYRNQKRKKRDEPV